jgi:hypothetical protein
VVERVICSSKAARGEDLQVEDPVACGDSASFHFHATLAGMLSPMLIRDQIIEVRQPCEKRLLAPTWMMKPLSSRKMFQRCWSAILSGCMRARVTPNIIE